MGLLLYLILAIFSLIAALPPSHDGNSLRNVPYLIHTGFYLHLRLYGWKASRRVQDFVWGI